VRDITQTESFAFWHSRRWKAVMGCASRLNTTDVEDLCEIGCILPARRKSLMQSVVFHVSEYEEDRTPHQIEKEVYAVYRRVESALWYLYRRERRPREFRQRMLDISNQLRKLSKPARACLAYRNAQLSFEIPKNGPAPLASLWTHLALKHSALIKFLPSITFSVGYPLRSPRSKTVASRARKKN
jgi:hypothetical protein